MKWIFSFMLAVNLVTAIWIYQTPDERNSTEKLAIDDVGDLKIVSDVELQVRADYQRKNRLAQNRSQAIKDDKNLSVQDLANENNTDPVCRLLGPFSERQHAIEIGSGLAAYRLITKVVKKTDRTIKGYWTILPAASSVNEANEIIDKLKSKGLVDVRRFSGGEMENAISAGLFSSEGNAIKRAREVEKIGFVAIVKPKYEVNEHFWLEYNQSPGFKLPIKGVRTNYPDVKIKSCSGIATN